MLPESFKSDVLELIDIAKACPEPLQARCLEMLLEHYLRGTGRAITSPDEGEGKPPAKGRSSNTNDSVGDPPESVSHPSSTGANGDGDIAPADLHVKAKKFLEKYGRTLAELNELFYKDGSEFKPLYDDLKTTKTSESQIRIGLLQALVSGMKDGEFQFDGEKVREECQLRKAYDGTNFTANFNNSSALFDGFDKYTKASSMIRLSEAGRKRLADLIPEMK